MANYVQDSVGFRRWMRETKKTIAFRRFISFINKNREIDSNSSILDVGFGAGDLLGGLLKKFPASKIFGIDVNNNYFEYVTNRFR